MANRDALRELQSRLADRLEAAKANAVSAHWLAVESAGQRFLFPLRQSGEIFSVSGVQPVAYTQPWFLGVANLRGGLFGVVDLGGFVYGHTPATPGGVGTGEARLVALNPTLERHCALLVDRLSGLRGTDAFPTVEPPDAQAPVYFGPRYTDTQGHIWQELNLQLLCAQERFIHINA